MNEPPERIGLIGENGEKREYLLHDAVELDEQTYYLVESAADPEEVLLLKEMAGVLATVEGEEFDRVLALLEAEE